MLLRMAMPLGTVVLTGSILNDYDKVKEQTGYLTNKERNICHCLVIVNWISAGLLVRNMFRAVRRR